MRILAVKDVSLLLTTIKEQAQAVNVTMTQAKILYILKIEMRQNREHYLFVCIRFLYMRVLLQPVVLNKMAAAPLRFRSVCEKNVDKFCNNR